MIIHNDVLQVSVYKDLGVTFESKLTFVDHIDTRILEAGPTYGFILRNCKDFNDQEVLKTWLFSYVYSKEVLKT